MLIVSQEARYGSLSDYLHGKQIYITSTNRKILLDWLVALVHQLSLPSEVLYLATFYVDKYLNDSHCPLRKECLQLLGLTSVFVASYPLKFFKI